MTERLPGAMHYARATVTRMLGRRCPDDIDDVLQDAALRALRHLSQFRGESSFESWFTSIAIRSALMHLRKYSRTTMLTDSISVATGGGSGSAGFDMPSWEPLPDAVAMAEERRRRLCEELDRMTPKRRRAGYRMLAGVTVPRGEGRSAEKALRHKVRERLREVIA